MRLEFDACDFFCYTSAKANSGWVLTHSLCNVLAILSFTTPLSELTFRDRVSISGLEVIFASLEPMLCFIRSYDQRRKLSDRSHDIRLVTCLRRVY